MEKKLITELAVLGSAGLALASTTGQAKAATNDNQSDAANAEASQKTTSSSDALAKAKSDYKKAQADVSSAEAQAKSASKAESSAQASYDQAVDNYNQASADVEQTVSSSDVQNAQNDVSQKQQAVDNAQKSADQAQADVQKKQQTADQAQQAVNTAQQTADASAQAQKTAQNKVDDLKKQTAEDPTAIADSQLIHYSSPADQQYYQDQLKNNVDFLQLKDPSQKTALQQTSVRQAIYNIDNFKASEADEHRMLHLDKLTSEEKTELNNFVLRAINSARKAAGSKELATNSTIQAMAQDIADGYKADNWKYGQGHDTKAIYKVTKNYGVQGTPEMQGVENLATLFVAPGFYITDPTIEYENGKAAMGGTGRQLTPNNPYYMSMASAKRLIYSGILSFLFNGDEWAHARSLVFGFNGNNGLAGVSVETYNTPEDSLSPENLRLHVISLDDTLLDHDAHGKIESSMANVEKVSGTPDVSAEELANYQNAKAQLASAETALATATVNASNANAQLEKAKTALSFAKQELASATSNYDAKVTALSQAKTALENSQKTYAQLKDAYENPIANKAKREEAKKQAKAKVDEAKKVLDSAKSALSAAKANLATAKSKLSKAKKNLSVAQSVYDQYNKQKADKKKSTSKKTSAKTSSKKKSTAKKSSVKTDSAKKTTTAKEPRAEKLVVTPTEKQVAVKPVVSRVASNAGKSANFAMPKRVVNSSEELPQTGAKTNRGFIFLGYSLILAALSAFGFEAARKRKH
ncbi:LPXTG cell wall anchor domain-containing protein [Lactobacillus corticis]|uniref:Gram-positive cocci surface proteins LPxTG domain-containing protein n=1 Tax=Lactobacillus corticis TaxID=2201249 RepID=A0A916QI61_9LACO|nr:SEC10/PgrA surface exclusion domain-containing protein [Lactobacillus corticis]GFZ27399.1 hypothetical protein LCB40_12790 [Lactobacillus corticis]